MKKLYRIAAAIAVASMCISTQAMAGGPPELAPAELSRVQSQRYSVPPKVAFNAVLSTLQSFGYTDVNADRDAGTISAITEAKAKTFFNIFWGFGKKKYTQKASLLIEEAGGGSLVRLNLHLNEMKARGIFGTSFSDGKLIRFAGPYQDFFRVLDNEVAVRGGSTGSAPSVAMPAVTGPVGATPSTSASASPRTVELGAGVRLIPAETPSGHCIEAPQGYVGTGSVSRPAVSSARPLCSQVAVTN